MGRVRKAPDPAGEDGGGGRPVAGELAEVGLRFATVLVLSALGGWWLDRRLGWTPWLTLLGTAAGFAAGFYWLILRVKQLEKDE